MISEEQTERALHYLAQTDEKYAQAKSWVKGSEYTLKIAKATAFLNCAEGTIAEREARSVVSDEFKEAVADHKAAWLEMEKLGAKRERAVLTIEVWRSENANRRKG